MNTREFTLHVLNEQLSHGPNGDAEYIRLAREALELEEYKGWSNKDTWRAWTEISNDEKLYRSFLVRFDDYSSMEQPLAALVDDLKRWGSKHLNLISVNWEEIAKALVE